MRCVFLDLCVIPTCPERTPRLRTCNMVAPVTHGRRKSHHLDSWRFFFRKLATHSSGFYNNSIFAFCVVFFVYVCAALGSTSRIWPMCNYVNYWVHTTPSAAAAAAAVALLIHVCPLGHTQFITFKWLLVCLFASSFHLEMYLVRPATKAMNLRFVRFGFRNRIDNSNNKIELWNFFDERCYVWWWWFTQTYNLWFIPAMIYIWLTLV